MKAEEMERVDVLGTYGAQVPINTKSIDFDVDNTQYRPHS